MARKKNKEVIIQIIILLIIEWLLISLMISKKVSYYVHPRFYIGIWISTVIIVLFIFLLSTKINKARHNVNGRHYLIFAIPIIAAFIFPATGVNSKEITFFGTENAKVNGSQGENINNNDNENDNYALNDSNNTNDNNELNDDNKENANNNTNDNNNSNANNNANDNNNSNVNNEMTENSNNTKDDKNQVNNNSDNSDELNSDDKQENITVGDLVSKYNKYEEDGVLVINDDIFAEWYNDVYTDVGAFKGKKCRYLAQVFSMDDFTDTQFLAGRYFMVCCAADLVGYGIICESDIRSQLKDEEWIVVEGTIQEYEYGGYKVPIITDVTISETEAPEIEYVYFNY